MIILWGEGGGGGGHGPTLCRIFWQKLMTPLDSASKLTIIDQCVKQFQPQFIPTPTPPYMSVSVQPNLSDLETCILGPLDPLDINWGKLCSKCVKVCASFQNRILPTVKATWNPTESTLQKRQENTPISSPSNQQPRKERCQRMKRAPPVSRPFPWLLFDRGSFAECSQLRLMLASLLNGFVFVLFLYVG